MLSPNCVCLHDVVVTRHPDCSPIGPVEVVTGGQTLEFWLPVISCPWALGEDGLVSSRIDLRLYCDQSSQNGGQTWYAFSHVKQRELFLKLIKVEKMGPKSAVQFLGRVPFDVVLQLIDTGDREAFLKLPGAGPKTGPKMVLELFKKAPAQPNTSVPVALILDEGAVQGMKALGFQATPARAAVKAAQEGLPLGADTATILKAALKSMAR